LPRRRVREKTNLNRSFDFRKHRIQLFLLVAVFILITLGLGFYEYNQIQQQRYVADILRRENIFCSDIHYCEVIVSVDVKTLSENGTFSYKGLQLDYSVVKEQKDQFTVNSVQFSIRPRSSYCLGPECSSIVYVLLVRSNPMTITYTLPIGMRVGYVSYLGSRLDTGSDDGVVRSLDGSGTNWHLYVVVIPIQAWGSQLVG